MHVSQVLLVAHPSRQLELAGWLRADRRADEASYGLHPVSPDDVPVVLLAWDVVVIDGESFMTSTARERLLRRIAEEPQGASILYVCGRLPLEDELAQARAWADDFIYPGWAQPERVRRRVEVVALAPWRRAAALRREAEERGDARLAVLPSSSSTAAAPHRAPLRAGSQSRLDRSRPFVLLERALRCDSGSGTSAEAVAEAFHEGRRVGVASVRESAERICAGVLEELEEGRATLPPEAARDIEETFGQEPSPLVAARFGGARAAVEALRSELLRLLGTELDAIGRHDVRPMGEP